MRKYLPLALLVMLGSCTVQTDVKPTAIFAVSMAHGQSPPVPTPPAPDPMPAPAPSINLPMTQPTPQPSPTAVSTLVRGQLYPVWAKQPFAIVTIPPGMLDRHCIRATKAGVKLVEPAQIPGVFAGGTGEFEVRPFDCSDLHLLTVAKGASGSVTVQLIPYGFTADSQIKTVTLIVSDPGPCPPGPTPGPPGPTPTPVPVDPLFSALQAAYTADTDPAKASEVQQIAAVYAQAVTQTVPDPTLTTLSALLTKVHNAGMSIVPAVKLDGIRTITAAELKAQLGDPSQTLDAPLRAKVASQFTRMATLLGGLK